MTSPAIDIAALRGLAEKAIGIDYVFASDTATNGQYRICANPRTVLALLDRLAAAEAVVEAARRWHETYWIGTKKTGRDYHEDAGSIRVLVNAYDRAIAAAAGQGEKP